jgi:hypothetical protein
VSQPRRDVPGDLDRLPRELCEKHVARRDGRPARTEVLLDAQRQRQRRWPPREQVDAAADERGPDVIGVAFD